MDLEARGTGAELRGVSNEDPGVVSVLEDARGEVPARLSGRAEDEERRLGAHMASPAGRKRPTSLR